MTIQAHALSFHYEGVSVLENISFEMREGEFVAIFGPNGGGKTTLLKIIMGFLKPQRGKVELFGASPQAGREKVGYVPQNAHLDRQFPITALDVVLMGSLDKSAWRSYLPYAKDKGREALRYVGLYDCQNRPFGTLSGGQAQRVLFARALVGEPKILLLDEPTASADPEAEETIYNLLEGLKRSMTIVMVTHDIQVVMKKVDRFLCVNKQATPYSPKELCDHFAQGLYHPRLSV